jgi:hypothetical protein
VVNLFRGQHWPAAEQHLYLQIGSLALALKDDAVAYVFCCCCCGDSGTGD